MAATFSYKLDKQKSFFLNRTEWFGIIDSGERAALARSGGHVRKTARRRLRPRNRPSNPGESPTAWGPPKKNKKGKKTGGRNSPLRNLITFHLDPNTFGNAQNSVVVGPAYLPEMHTNIAFLSQHTIPRTLEFGGRETKVNAPEMIELFGGAMTTDEPTNSFFIEARPYMVPALKKSLPAIRRNFKEMIVRGGVGIRRVGRRAA